MLGWIDLETTGLDIDRVEILEVACCVTDDNLQELGRHLGIVRPSKEPLFEAGAYEMHKANGLLVAVKQFGYSVEIVDKDLAAFLRSFITNNKPLMMAGNTIGFDRVLMRKHLPISYECFHYRTIDVSSLKELCRRWRPAVYRQYADGIGKTKHHRAMDDVLQSIEELKIYRTALFDINVVP